MHELWLAALTQIGTMLMAKLLRRKGEPPVETPRPNDPLWQIKNPATDELRAIYREIDAEALITDPDLLTPDGKIETLPIMLGPVRLHLDSWINMDSRGAPIYRDRGTVRRDGKKQA